MTNRKDGPTIDGYFVEHEQTNVMRLKDKLHNRVSFVKSKFDPLVRTTADLVYTDDKLIRLVTLGCFAPGTTNELLGRDGAVLAFAAPYVLRLIAFGVKFQVYGWSALDHHKRK